MVDVFINPLSASWQFHATTEVKAAIGAVVDCFKFLLPALEHKRVRLVYDNSIERRSLMVGSPCLTVDLSGLGDTARLWFLFVKNRAHQADSVQCAVVVSGAGVDVGSIAGEVRNELVEDNANWLSIRGTLVNEQPQLEVLETELRSRVTVTNIVSLASLRAWCPRYEASPKHRKEGYWRGGEWVSPMPLDEQTAQMVLLGSIEVGDDRYAYFRGRYFRFPKTGPDDTFHGFLITREEVPAEIRAQLEA